MSSRRVVVISDCTDLAFAEMRGAILSAAETESTTADVRIEPLAPSAAFSVINTGFVVRMMAEAYPPDTILMFVMNSLKERTERIVGRTGRGQIFEGTNTGAIGWLLADHGLSEVREVTDPGFVPFGGKYVHAPTVGRLAAGASLADVSGPFDPARVRHTVPQKGELVHVDNFGNGKFRWDAEFAEGTLLAVTLPGGTAIHAVAGKRMMEFDDGTWVVYPGSSLDLVELGQVRAPGLLQYGSVPGQVIDIVEVRN